MAEDGMTQAEKNELQILERLGMTAEEYVQYIWDDIGLVPPRHNEPQES